MISERNAVQKNDVQKNDYRTMARMRTGASPGFLSLAGATMMRDPVEGSEVKRAAPSST